MSAGSLDISAPGGGILSWKKSKGKRVEFLKNKQKNKCQNIWLQRSENWSTITRKLARNSIIQCILNVIPIHYKYAHPFVYLGKIEFFLLAQTVRYLDPGFSVVFCWSLFYLGFNFPLAKTFLKTTQMNVGSGTETLPIKVSLQDGWCSAGFANHVSDQWCHHQYQPDLCC